MVQLGAMKQKLSHHPHRPGLANPAPLQHYVRDARLRELVADRQPGLTATNDHDICLIGHRATWAIWTRAVSFGCMVSSGESLICRTLDQPATLRLGAPP